MKQVFNIDENSPFWKRMPMRTYISKKDRTAPGFKAAKNQVMEYWVVILMEIMS
jgi:hypothetical protein